MESIHTFNPSSSTGSNEIMVIAMMAIAMAILMALLVGCTESTEKGKLRPEGPPEIQEVFMFEAAKLPAKQELAERRCQRERDDQGRENRNDIGDTQWPEKPAFQTLQEEQGDERDHDDDDEHR
jgi:hypothetical protein